MKRRTFLKGSGYTGAALVGSGLMPGPGIRTATAQAGPPNILVIIVDQLRHPQGPFDQQVMDQVAPNLARLRGQSVSFEAHYTASNMCSPARSTMLTGLYTHQNGMFLTNTGGITDGGGNQVSTPSLNPGFPTYGTILARDFGYRTNWYGKWHLSSNDQLEIGQPGACDYTMYGFEAPGTPYSCPPPPDDPLGQICPSPNGAPGAGLPADPCIAATFENWLQEFGDQGPWCTTMSLVNPHDIAFYPNGTVSNPGEDDPPQRFDRLPDNFETQQQLFLQGKPALQRNFSAAVDFTAGLLPKSGPGFEQGWTGLLDTYALVTGLVDDQIGRIMSALESRPEIAANTIVIFTADHGEYAGAHGLRNKGGAVYEEAIRVPLYIRDPIRPLARGAGTTRAQMTSSVDLVPLLMTLGSGDDAWRRDPRYAHLARRIDIDAILSNPNVRGRRYILHATDEDFLEEGPRTGKFAGALFGLGAPNHVIGLRTAREKLGVNSFWAPNSIEIRRDGQEFEAYDYTSSDGTQELINVAPSNPDRSLRNRGLFTSSYNFLFRQAVRHELRRPLPSYLQATQQEAINDYLAYKQAVARG